MVGAVYSCQSRAKEATFSSFSRDLLALCNGSELLLPGCRPSMLTTNTHRQLGNDVRPVQQTLSKADINKNKRQFMFSKVLIDAFKARSRIHLDTKDYADANGFVLS